MEAPQIKKKINSLTSLGKSIQLDASLMQVFPGVLAKGPTERGSFDSVILQQLEETFSKSLTEIEEKLGSFLLPVREHEAAVQEAKSLLTRVLEKCRASEECVNAANARSLECEEILRSAERAVQSLEPEFEAIVVTRESALEKLATFRSNQLAALHELKERTKDDTSCKDNLGTIADHRTSEDDTIAHEIIGFGGLSA